jgi:hypothetical protein
MLGVLTDNAMGMFAYDTIYRDDDADQMESLPPTQPHRTVDLEVVNAARFIRFIFNERVAQRSLVISYVKTYIVLPSTIYGVATGRLVDVDVQHSHSQQLPTLIKAGLARG